MGAHSKMLGDLGSVPGRPPTETVNCRFPQKWITGAFPNSFSLPVSFDLNGGDSPHPQDGVGFISIEKQWITGEFPNSSSPVTRFV